MMAMTNSEPARLPQNVMNQCSSIFQGESRRCKTAIVVSCSWNNKNIVSYVDFFSLLTSH
jgi:hypothetical protein